MGGHSLLRSRLAIANASKTLHPASGRIDTRESGERESLSLPGTDPEAKTDLGLPLKFKVPTTARGYTGATSGAFLYDQFILEY